MTTLKVVVADTSGPLADVAVRMWALPARANGSVLRFGDLTPEEAAAALSSSDGPIELPSAWANQVVVEIERAPYPRLQVPLALGAANPFIDGRPTMMSLAGTRDTRELRVRWPNPQEVVMASGYNLGVDTRLAERAMSRFARLLQRGEIGSGCVLTLFDFRADDPNAEVHNLDYAVHAFLPGSPTAEALARRPARLRRHSLVLMTSHELPTLSFPRLEHTAADPSHLAEHRDRSVLTVYCHLQLAGARLRDTPGATPWIRELGFVSHAYWVGPTLYDTYRYSDRFTYVDPAWLSVIGTDQCVEACPIDRPHSYEPAPGQSNVYVQLRDGLERNDCLHDFDTLGSADPPRSAGTYEQAAFAAVAPRLTDGVPAHRRTPDDHDPRNTDFVPGAIAGFDVSLARSALRPDAVVRVWGCSSGPLAPLVRGLANVIAANDPPDNKMLTVHGLRSAHDSSAPPVFARWRVRRGDFDLHYLSQLRRCYAQAIATALQRPSFAALAGTGANFVDGDLGALAVPSELQATMLPYARNAGLLPENAGPDANGYFRFDPTPPTSTRVVRVLVTGFAPWMPPAATNASSEAVRQVNQDAIRAAIVYPPWISGATVAFLPVADVPVVWNCGAPGVSPSAGPGEIVQRARDFDAHIVVAVGETQEPGLDLRLEYAAHNRGSGSDASVPPVTLPSGTELFALQPETLRSTVTPSHRSTAWLRLRQAGLTSPQATDTSAGDYLCNCTFYQLLKEARIDNGGSGRWVQFVHVGASAPVATLARGLEIVIATLVERMLWAVEAGETEQAFSETADNLSSP